MVFELFAAAARAPPSTALIRTRRGNYVFAKHFAIITFYLSLTVLQHILKQNFTMNQVSSVQKALIEKRKYRANDAITLERDVSRL